MLALAGTFLFGWLHSYIRAPIVESVSDEFMGSKWLSQRIRVRNSLLARRNFKSIFSLLAVGLVSDNFFSEGSLFLCLKIDNPFWSFHLS